MRQEESNQDIVDNIECLNAQTRLLAFNVMMEAVRSGQEAKGFAQVANELSELTQNATATVHNLTQESLDREVLMAAVLEKNIQATEDLRDSFKHSRTNQCRDYTITCSQTFAQKRTQSSVTRPEICARSDDLLSNY